MGRLTRAALLAITLLCTSAWVAAGPPGYDAHAGATPAPGRTPDAAQVGPRITSVDVVPAGAKAGLVTVHAGDACNVVVNVKRNSLQPFEVQVEVDGQNLAVQDSITRTFAWDQATFSWSWAATGGSHVVKAKLFSGDSFSTVSVTPYYFEAAGGSGDSRFPDLTIDKVNLGSGEGSLDFNIEVVVSNRGEAAAPAPFDILVRAGGLSRTFTRNSALKPGETITFKWAIALSAWKSKPNGRAVVDPGGNVKERDRVNNVKDF